MSRLSEASPPPHRLAPTSKVVVLIKSMSKSKSKVPSLKSQWNFGTVAVN